MAARRKKTEMEEDILKLKGMLETVERMVKGIKTTGISDRALYLLIQAAAGTGSRGRKIPMSTIRAVVEGMEAIREFTFPEED